MAFQILFEDEHIVAINKPTGIMVHRTGISEDRVFVLQLLRDQLNQRIFPIHRLDRATSGVLLFGKNKEIAGMLGAQLMGKNIDKKYIAITRGFVPESGTIDSPLPNEVTGVVQDAITHFVRLGTSEIDEPIGLRYKTARFSLVEVTPETGRTHQIRKHFSHLRFPIIGDSQHGDVKHNKYFREKFGMNRMLLHARLLGFVHPVLQTAMQLTAPLDDLFVDGLRITGLQSALVWAE